VLENLFLYLYDNTGVYLKEMCDEII